MSTCEDDLLKHITNPLTPQLHLKFSLPTSKYITKPLNALLQMTNLIEGMSAVRSTSTEQQK